MARVKTNFIAAHISAQELAAVKRLERLKYPHRKSCTSAVISDCIKYAYGILNAKYTGVPVTEPQPLPKLPETDAANI